MARVEEHAGPMFSPMAGSSPSAVGQGFGDEAGDLLEPFLNLKKLHGTPSLFESLHYIGKGQGLKVSSNK